MDHRPSGCVTMLTNQKATYVVVGMALALSSCGERGLYPASGRMTFKGEPAVGATVFLQRPGGSSSTDQMMMGIVRERPRMLLP
jgi:hypothetical protein